MLHQDISILGLKDQIHYQRNLKLPSHATCPHKDNYDGQNRVALDVQALKDPDPLQFLDDTKEMPSIEIGGSVKREATYTPVWCEAPHLLFFS